MGTRGVIARVTGDGFEGRYHHWDSYPTQLGRSLYTFAQQIGVKRLLEILVDEHVVGWSTINGHDITKTPGYLELGKRHDGEPERFTDAHTAWERTQGPQCYCHGDRHETEPLLITDVSADAGAEWAYAINEDTLGMVVYKRVYTSSESKWRLVGVVHLDAPEPDWAALEAGEDA